MDQESAVRLTILVISMVSWIGIVIILIKLGAIQDTLDSVKWRR